jgi:3-dehydroquinate dehydratase-2
MKILVINGPNINMLGTREKEKYGSLTLDEIEKYTNESLPAGVAKLDWWQSNSETEIIEKIHKLVSGEYDALIINPAAYSHTSIAILDALNCIEIPIVEVHLTNVYRRENFRQQMLTARASSIIMSGLGKDAYCYAALALLRQ